MSFSLVQRELREGSDTLKFWKNAFSQMCKKGGTTRDMEGLFVFCFGVSTY